MRPCRASLAILSTVLLLAETGSARSQQTVDALDLQREVLDAHEKSVAASKALHGDLVALVPSVTGWSCEEAEGRQDARGRWMTAIPSVEIRCKHKEHSLDISLILDASAASLICRDIVTTQREIAEGRTKPNLFRFFQGVSWQVMRAGVDIKGCVKGSVALWAHGDRSEHHSDVGVIDDFAQALLNADPDPLTRAAEGVGMEAALTRLMDRLNAQSRLMAEILPAPPGAERKVLLPAMESLPEADRLPRPLILSGSPSASVTIESGGCGIMLQMSGSPNALHEAMELEGWGRPRGKEGSINGAFIRRNAGRVIGREAVDGTGIKAVVDGSVVVRVDIAGNHTCEDDPAIVRRLFDEILENDLSVFAAR